MRSTSDDSDPDQAYEISPAQRLENERRGPGFIASNGLFLPTIVKESPRWCNPENHVWLIDGRTRSLSRARASGSHDSQPRRRRGSVSPASGTAHLSSACLLQTPICTNRAWSDGSGGPPARGVDRHSYPSSYLPAVAAVHTLDPRDRALQISGLSSSDQIVVQGPAARERPRTHVK